MEKKDKGFKGLIVWQKAYALALDIYRVSIKFPKDERFGLVSQIRRAAVSIPANISEGYERNHRKEYVQFLFVSKGSLGEVETHLLLSKDLGYLSEVEYSVIENRRSETARLLIG